MQRLSVAMCAFLLACGLWLCRPDPPLDPNRVDGRLRNLNEPFSDVHVDYLWDGGSVLIRISDANQDQESFFFPATLDGENRYERLLVGAGYADEHDTVEVKNPEHTKRRLVQILRKYKGGDRWGDIALWCLTRRWSDYARLWFRAARGDYEPWE